MSAEARKLLALWTASRQIGEEFALATVVHVEGSSYRKPGARMMVTRSGLRAGTVSGGCLEAEVARKIWWLTENGASIGEYKTSFDDESQPSYGLGCSGTLSILLERDTSATAILQALENSATQRVSFAIVTVIATDTPDVVLGSRLIVQQSEPCPNPGLPELLYQRLLPIAHRSLKSGLSRHEIVSFRGSRIEIFAEYLAPPPALYIFGAGDDARPLADLAHSMGWRVTVADGRSHLAAAERFPNVDRVGVLDLTSPLKDITIAAADAAVIVTHSYVQDLAILPALLPLSLAYLGILGPRSRTLRLVEEIAASAQLDADRILGSIKSPIGLDLGGGSPEVIALSVVAEIQAVLSQRSGTSLSLVAAPEAIAARG